LDLAREALRWLEARGVYAQTYHGDDWYCERACAISEEYGRSTGIPGKEAGMPLSAFIREPAPKLLGVAEPETVRRLLAEAREIFVDRLSVTTSKPHFLEITSPTATKGNAVRWLAEKLSLSPETTICAGDSLNDLTMLAWSRLPVAVANARDEVKRAAWRVAGDGREDGMARLLDELIAEVSHED